MNINLCGVVVCLCGVANILSMLEWCTKSDELLNQMYAGSRSVSVTLVLDMKNFFCSLDPPSTHWTLATQELHTCLTYTVVVTGL